MFFGMTAPMTVSATLEDKTSKLKEERVADESTINDWKQFFEEETDTSNAGRIWTDKTVVDGNITVNERDKIIQRMGQDNFLVGLSALSSTQSVTIKAAKPVDLMLVCDISTSMMGEMNGKSKLRLMGEQINNMIQAVLAMNTKNRVGVVCFSGATVAGNSSRESAFCLFPLDRYTTKSGDYVWIDESNPRGGYIGIDQTVQNSSEQQMNPDGKQKYRVRGDTYMQNGLLEGLENFPTSPEIFENSESRIPIVTLITDGAPTAINVNYTERGDSTLTTVDETDIRQAFFTQLTAAWINKKLQESYQIDPLFYTLGIAEGVGDIELSYIREVLNPSTGNDPDMEVWWKQFLEAERGVPIELKSSGKTIQVTKADDQLQKEEDRYYVDKYFEIDSTTTLINSFKQLIELIEIQTAELPTEEGQTGTLMFEDSIGQYMNVKYMNGVMYDGKLHSGSTFSEKMSSNGSFESEEWEEVLNVLKERVGIATKEQAEELLVNAQETGQISYTSEEEFSNYVAWYAAEDGEYMEPYREGEVNPVGSAFLNRSYFYYGNTLESTNGGELLKIEVRIEENLTTHAQKVKFFVPSSLIPLVRYDVMTMAGESKGSKTEKTATFPIHLFYEVGMWEDVSGYGMSSIDSEYPYVESTDIVRTSTFYTNRWKIQGEIAEAETFVNFTVSDKNDYYYYTKATPIYRKTETGEFEFYTGTKPQENDGNEYYYKKTVYNLNGGEQVLNLPIESTSLKNTVQDETGGWLISSGTFRYETMRMEVKNDGKNSTETAEYVWKSVLQSENGAVRVFLGNNGKLMIRQGKIVISKIVQDDEFAENHDENTEFEIEIDLNLMEGESVPLLVIGEKKGQKIECPVVEGKIKFRLKNRENIEFWLPDGKCVSVEEIGENASYYTINITVTKVGETSKSNQRNTKEEVEVETENKSLVVVENSVPIQPLYPYKVTETGEPLEGAKFNLYRLKCINPESHTEKEHKHIIQKGESQECWEFLGEAISESDGYFIFMNNGEYVRYKKGTYRFVEVEAPDGYITPVGQWNVYVDPKADKKIVIEEILGPNGERPPAVYVMNFDINFYNYKPLNPPITGGRGIWHYLLLGAVVTCGGIGLGIYQTRRRKHGNS